MRIITLEEVNEVCSNLIRHARDVFGARAKKYSTDGDRLANFRQTAALEFKGEVSTRNMSKSLLSKVSKQIAALYQYADDRSPNIINTINQWIEIDRNVTKELLGDIINYCLLLECIYEEERRNCESIEKLVEEKLDAPPPGFEDNNELIKDYKDLYNAMNPEIEEVDTLLSGDK